LNSRQHPAAHIKKYKVPTKDTAIIPSRALRLYPRSSFLAPRWTFTWHDTIRLDSKKNQWKKVYPNQTAKEVAVWIGEMSGEAVYQTELAALAWQASSSPTASQGYEHRRATNESDLLLQLKLSTSITL